MGHFSVTIAAPADLRMMTEWAAGEGWNPGADDRIAFAAADPTGFLIGRLDGEPITCISVVRYGADGGFLGFYITRPEFRGQGYGLRTWQFAMSRMDGRNVGLDGVVAQQANYRKSGFQTTWNNIRFAGIPATAPDVPGVTFTDAMTLPADTLLDYDRRFFPGDRRAFLACWLALPDRAAIAALQDGQLAGFGVVRRARVGSRIGPLYAASPAIASALLARLSGGMPTAIDIPEGNARMASAAGLTPIFETARMYTGPSPAIDHSGLFGVASLELG